METTLKTIGLLLMSNVFMTFAWYGHLKYKTSPLYIAILVSWGIAFFEYCLPVTGQPHGFRPFIDGAAQNHPGNHHALRFRRVFGVVPERAATLNHAIGFFFLIVAAFFIFKTKA